MSDGPFHYREAERLARLAASQYQNSQVGDPAPLWQFTMAQAQVSATLAHTAAVIEVADSTRETGNDLIRRPHPGSPEEFEPAFPGTPWGRAFYGDPTA